MIVRVSIRSCHQIMPRLLPNWHPTPKESLQFSSKLGVKNMPLGPNFLTFKEVISRIMSFYLFPTNFIV